MHKIWKDRKGMIHIGFGVLLLLLIVIYVFVKLGSPETGNNVDVALKNLSTSVQGLIPFT